MIEVTFQIPDALADLPQAERDALLRAGLREAVAARVRQLEAEIAEAAEQVRVFEARYGGSLARFEAEALPTLDSPEAHEDYADWFFWQNVLDEKETVLAGLRVAPGIEIPV